jgi:hypothetical protein
MPKDDFMRGLETADDFLQTKSAPGLGAARQMRTVPDCLRLAWRAAKPQVVEVEIHKVAADLQIENAEAIEVSARGFVLLRDASGLRVAVKGDNHFASFADGVRDVAKRPLMRLAIRLNGRPGVFEVTPAQTIIVAPAEVMPDLTRAFDENGENICRRSFTI